MKFWEGLITACERHILITDFVSNSIAYVMDIYMDIMKVGLFERTGCLIPMFPNDMQESKIKSQGIPIGSFTLPKVAANDEANAEEDEDIAPMDE